MSCGQIALERAGIKVDTYYASEINEHSIKITQKNYPKTIQLGDVTKLTDEQLLQLGEIDLLIGGSPCKNLSRIVINNDEHNQGLDGAESRLFYEYIRVKNIVCPKNFLLENVESMNDEDKDIITEFLNVEPIMINSARVSAADRKRYYWTNITNIDQPEDKGIVIKDIMQSEIEINKKYYYDKPFEFYGLDKKVCGKLQLNTQDLLKRVYHPYNKCGTLTAVSGGYQEKKVYIPETGKVRKLTPLEYERMQTVPEGYTESVNDSHRWSMLGNGWTIDVIAHIFKYIEVKNEIYA